MKPKSEWARIVKALRKEHKMTQREFADAVGVTSATVSLWERGECKPSYLAKNVLDKLSCKH